VGGDTSFALASERAGNLGYFVRTLVGLDRAAAKEALAEFLDDKRHTRAQIEFIYLIIDELTERGVVEPGRIYENPYVSLAPHGPEDLFAEDELDRLVATLAQLLPAEHEASP
jgi:type I restriction enzyme, R subunit